MGPAPLASSETPTLASLAPMPALTAPALSCLTPGHVKMGPAEAPVTLSRSTGTHPIFLSVTLLNLPQWAPPSPWLPLPPNPNLPSNLSFRPVWLVVPGVCLPGGPQAFPPPRELLLPFPLERKRLDFSPSVSEFPPGRQGCVCVHTRTCGGGHPPAQRGC